MMQGSTATHTFTLPFTTAIVEECRITYAQCGEIVLTKETADCELNGNTIRCKLTQDETLSFDHKNRVKIQLQVRQKNGTALVSDTHTVSVGKCLSGEVL